MTRRSAKIDAEVYADLEAVAVAEGERLGLGRLTISQAVARLLAVYHLSTAGRQPVDNLSTGGGQEVDNLSTEVSTTCLPAVDNLSTHGGQPVDNLSTSGRQGDPLRGCDSRAAVPAYFSAEEEREEKRERALPLETKEVGEGNARTRAVTADWIVSRWNAWAAKRRGDGFDPKHVDLEREQPSRGYVTGLVRLIHQHRKKRPSLDDWRRALDALDALPDHAARTLRLDGPDKLFGWTHNDPLERPKLWRIADGEWSTWTSPSVTAAPVQIATTMPPVLHPDPDADVVHPDCDMGWAGPNDWTGLLDKETA